MYRSDRFFNKKRNGQHNFFGEEDDLVFKNGTIQNEYNEQEYETPPEAQTAKSETESG